ncbi:DUF4198 domain-containing protein [Arcticibacter eurypsychrophilus]|uniref:DUF4198 domain-containing protein n=1 Tax=Arcticibacter eurypsychrophilus TaxID=1434752 RepID=UPI00084D548E|nr:DUF4198 domain-containing protein [Arcticibacter eurypsychrophilus]
MKYIYTTFIILLFAGAGSAQEYYLKPQTFMPNSEKEVVIDLYRGNKFDTAVDRKIENVKIKSAAYFKDSKPVSLIDSAGALKSSFLIPLKDKGLYLTSVELYGSVEQKSKTSLSNQFTEEGFADLAEKIAMKQLFSINNHYAVKTLIMAEKPSGDAYKMPSESDFEIVLMQNPYKMKYGEDVTVQILSKGKSLPKVHVSIVTKTLSGSLFSSEQITDDDGKVYVKLNRAGIWLIKAINIVPAEKEADFDRWFSSYSFSFNNL